MASLGANHWWDSRSATARADADRCSPRFLFRALSRPCTTVSLLKRFCLQGHGFDHCITARSCCRCFCFYISCGLFGAGVTTLKPPTECPRVAARTAMIGSHRIFLPWDARAFFSTRVAEGFLQVFPGRDDRAPLIWVVTRFRR
jgi:hypothetical protein